MREFIIGGIRSGKSRLAETLAAASDLPVTYIATATAGDEEMRARIAAHRERRNPNWRVVEEPLALANTLLAHAAPDRCVVVDCLTLWLTNLLCADDPARLALERKALSDALPRIDGRVIFVANETGLGVIPVAHLARRFCDEAGGLHQEMANACDRVIFTLAGLPHVLKGDRL